MELPNREKLISIISAFKNADLSLVTYERIINILVSELKSIPYTTAKLKAGHHIERARINKPSEIFTSESQITYRTDYGNIKEYGRANSPNQSLFYGAIKNDNIKNARLVNLFETSELFRTPNLNSSDFIMTVGRWRIKEDIVVAELVFNKQNIINIPSIKESFTHHYDILKKDFPDRIDDIEMILEYFSDEFSKKEIKSHNDYKISSAYAELAIQVQGLAGVVYPSVRTDYQGTNVALKMQTVENYLELEVAAMFHIYKKNNHSFMDNAFITSNFGALNSNFKWEKIQEQDENTINKILND